MMKKTVSLELKTSNTAPIMKTEHQTEGGKENKMRYHKTFAWLTVICFILAIITGYEKK